MKIRGVGRVADDQRALLIACDRIPTDSDIRKLHNYLQNFTQSEDAADKGPTCLNCGEPIRKCDGCDGTC